MGLLKGITVIFFLAFSISLAQEIPGAPNDDTMFHHGPNEFYSQWAKIKEMENRLLREHLSYLAMSCHRYPYNPYYRRGQAPRPLGPNDLHILPPAPLGREDIHIQPPAPPVRPLGREDIHIQPPAPVDSLGRPVRPDWNPYEVNVDETVHLRRNKRQQGCTCAPGLPGHPGLPGLPGIPGLKGSAGLTEQDVVNLITSRASELCCQPQQN